MANESMGVKLSANDSMASQLAKIGQMAYGVKYGKGTSGGNGYVGMIGDRVVKFNTHMSERRGPETASMRESCDQLRATLFGVATRLHADGKLGDGDFSTLCKDLGLGTNGALAKGRSLLTRKVVARAITAFTQSDSRLSGVWRDARTNGVSTRAHTAYADLRRAEDMSSFNDLAECRLDEKKLDSPKPVRKGLTLAMPAGPKNTRLAAICARCQKQLTDLAGNVYSGKTELKDALSSLGNLLGEFEGKCRSEGVELKKNVKTVENLKSFSVELARVAMSGKRARGLKPVSAPKALTPSQLNALDAAIGRTADRIMKSMSDCREKGGEDPVGRYESELTQGHVEDREILLEQIKEELYASPELLEAVQKETDHKAMGELTEKFKSEAHDDLAAMVNRHAENVEQSVRTDFPREINSPQLAKKITINGVNQQAVYEDDSIVLSETELNDIGKGGTGRKVGSQRIARNVIDLVPSEHPARMEIVNLLTTFMCPVSGPSGQCGMTWDLGFGLGYVNLGRGKFGDTTDATMPSTTCDLRTENGTITLKGQFDVGPTYMSKQFGKTFIPKNRISFELKIPLDQEHPASPTDLKYSITAKYSDVFI